MLPVVSMSIGFSFGRFRLSVGVVAHRRDIRVLDARETPASGIVVADHDVLDLPREAGMRSRYQGEECALQ